MQKICQDNFGKGKSNVNRNIEWSNGNNYNISSSDDDNNKGSKCGRNNDQMMVMQ